MNPEPPPILDGNLIPQFKIDKILNSKVVQGKLQYLIQWKGYRYEQNSWELEENVDNAKEALTAFH